MIERDVGFGGEGIHEAFYNRTFRILYHFYKTEKIGDRSQ